MKAKPKIADAKAKVSRREKPAGTNKRAEGLRLYNEYLSAIRSKHHKIAKEKLRKSARLGEVMAKHALAYTSSKHSSVEDNGTLRLYREAARAGFAPSAWNLARHYERNGKKALYFRWLRRTAELGDPEAANEMKNPAPYLYKIGISQLRKRRFAEGLATIRTAAKWGNVDALRKLETLDNK